MRTTSLLKAAFLGCFVLLGSARATQIAQFLEANGTNDFSLVNNGTNSVTLNATSQILFLFAGPLTPPTFTVGVPRAATLTFTATSTTAATNSAGNDSEVGFFGTFTIIDNSLGTNLLSGTFGSNGSLSGTAGGNSATFSDSAPPTTEVNFASAYLTFQPGSSEAFSLSLSNLVPSLSIAKDGLLANFNAAATGTFSAVPTPTVNPTPEPAAMALMGFGLVSVGFIAKRKRKA